MKKLLLALAFFLFIAPTAHAQGTLIQLHPTPLNGCTPSHTDAAINTLVTVTVTPPSGMYVYVCGIEWQFTQDGTGAAVAATNVKWTTTNLFGLAFEFSSIATINTGTSGSYMYTFPVKAANPGLAITFVSPAINAHAMYSATVWYYFAP